jgi:hypothetical protein
VIDVDFGDGIPVKFDERKLDGPHRTVTDNERERTVVTEYKLMGRVVHRSVHVHLKQGLGIEAAMGAFHG